MKYAIMVSNSKFLSLPVFCGREDLGGSPRCDTYSCIVCP